VIRDFKFIISGVDVDSEVPEHSRKNIDDLFDDFRKRSRFFLRKILNDLFGPLQISAGTLKTKGSGSSTPLFIMHCFAKLCDILLCYNDQC